MSNLEQVLRAIQQLDREDINIVVGAIKQRREQLTKTKLASFNAGDKVKVAEGKLSGQLGQIIKVNRKYLQANINGQVWRIPATMVTKI
jgi:transcription antitermination factor NusG